MRGFDPEIRRSAAREVLGGAKAKEVAERRGVSVATVWNWVHALEREAEERRERTMARILARNAESMALVEIQTDEGLVLAAVNVGRGGARTGTVQRIAGAHAGAGDRIRGRVTRIWFVDPVLMRSIADAHVSNACKA